MLRLGSQVSSARVAAFQLPLEEPASAARTQSHPLSTISTTDTEQFFDVYESEINNTLESLEIAGIPALREHQATAIAYALNNENIFLALATGAGKSLCFQIPAVIQARHHQQVTVVIQPTLEIISSQVKALCAHGIDVEVISSLTSSEEKDTLAERLYKEAYRPALIYTTPDSFFRHYNYVFTTLLGKVALARIVLDEGHTILYWKEFRPFMVSLYALGQYSRHNLTI